MTNRHASPHPRRRGRECGRGARGEGRRRGGRAGGRGGGHPGAPRMNILMPGLGNRGVPGGMGERRALETVSMCARDMEVSVWTSHIRAGMYVRVSVAMHCYAYIHARWLVFVPGYWCLMLERDLLHTHSCVARDDYARTNAADQLRFELRGSLRRAARLTSFFSPLHCGARKHGFRIRSTNRPGQAFCYDATRNLKSIHIHRADPIPTATAHTHARVSTICPHLPCPRRSSRPPLETGRRSPEAKHRVSQ